MVNRRHRGYRGQLGRIRTHNHWSLLVGRERRLFLAGKVESLNASLAQPEKPERGHHAKTQPDHHDQLKKVH